MKKFEFPFGSVTLVKFPEIATKFTDFPDGRFIINVPPPRLPKDSGIEAAKVSLLANLIAGDCLHYKVSVVPPSERRGLTAEAALEQIRPVIQDYIKEEYKESGKEIVGGMKALGRILQFHFNPSKVKGTRGSVQLIHGVSSPDSKAGTNVFELYFPRGIRLHMRGDRGTTPQLTSLITSFTGKVEFAHRAYRFTLRGADSDWNNFINPADTEEEFRLFLSKQYRIHAPMSTEDAARQMRENIYRLYPFIQQYDMLGEFVFDKPHDVETMVALWRQWRENDAAVDVALNTKKEQNDE